MDKDTRNAIERATQRARKLLEEDFAAQLEGDFDVHEDGEMAANAGTAARSPCHSSRGLLRARSPSEARRARHRVE